MADIDGDFGHVVDDLADSVHLLVLDACTTAIEQAVNALTECKVHDQSLETDLKKVRRRLRNYINTNF